MRSRVRRQLRGTEKGEKTAKGSTGNIAPAPTEKVAPVEGEPGVSAEPAPAGGKKKTKKKAKNGRRKKLFG
jgi:hypothetical protein